MVVGFPEVALNSWSAFSYEYGSCEVLGAIFKSQPYQNI